MWGHNCVSVVGVDLYGEGVGLSAVNQTTEVRASERKDSHNLLPEES